MRAFTNSAHSARSPSKHFDKIFDTNVCGLLFTVQKSLPLHVTGTELVVDGGFVGA
jgi:NAD(P)-dependent dehydrogenase (short-subunit alcohol dehydrogenase family)